MELGGQSAFFPVVLGLRVAYAAFPTFFGFAVNLDEQYHSCAPRAHLVKTLLGKFDGLLDAGELLPEPGG